MNAPRDLPPPDDRRFLERVREELQRLMGRRGSDEDVALTARNIGSISSAVGGISFTGGVSGEEPDLTPPPTVGTLAAAAGISQVIVTWSGITYPQGHGNKQTIIYAVKKDPSDPTLPTFPGEAGRVAVAPQALTIVAIPSEPNTRWHIWAKFETVDGVLSATPAGGTNGEVVTTGQDVRHLIDVLTQAAFNPALPYNRIAFRSDQFIIAPEVDFSQEATPAGTVVGQLWFKPSTGVTKTWDGSAWQAFNTPLPFIVQTTPTTINGVLIPAGVYMDAAFIYDLTASIARLGTAWIDDAMVGSMNVAKLVAGSLAVGQFMQSQGYVPGSAGWKITAAGVAEFQDALIRGVLQASEIRNAAGALWLTSDNTGSPPWVVNGETVGGGVELTNGVNADNKVELRSLEAGDGIDLSVTPAGAVRIASKSSDDGAIRLDGDFATSSTTVAAIPDFVLALEANTVYRIEGTLRYRAAAATTGIKIGGILPSTASGVLRVSANVTETALESRLLTIPTGGATQSVALSATWAAAAGSPSTFSSSDDAICTLEGIIETGADAGSFQFCAGTEVGASTITVRDGSVMTKENVKTVATVGGTTYGLDATPGFDTDYAYESISIIGKPRTAGLRITLDELGNWTIATSGTVGTLTAGSPTSGTWAASVGAGAGAQWQVQFNTTAQSTSEATISNGAATYQSLSSARSYSVSVSSALDDSPFFDTVTVDILMRNVASGAVTTLATVDLTVTAETS